MADGNLGEEMGVRGGSHGRTAHLFTQHSLFLCWVRSGHGDSEGLMAMDVQRPMCRRDALMLLPAGWLGQEASQLCTL